MTAHEETTNPYNGNWTATWEGGKGMHQHLNQADVVIADNGGSFDNRYSSTRNPCVGRKAPTRVIAARTAQAVTAMLQMVGYDPNRTSATSNNERRLMHHTADITRVKF